MDTDYICSKNNNSGMHFCTNLPAFKNGTVTCTLTVEQKNLPQYSDNDSYCVNWHIYYTLCSDRNENPFQDTISFDNIGLAWIAIFLVSNLLVLFFFNIFISKMPEDIKFIWMLQYLCVTWFK